MLSTVSVVSRPVSECSRIADQLCRVFDGDAWHGPPLRELLADVTAKQAYSHPIPGAHSIWELVLHIAVWAQAALPAMGGTPMPTIIGTVEDWPRITDSGPAAWKDAVDRLFQAKEEAAAAIAQFTDVRLTDIVAGREYDFYFLFHGIIQHSLYHGGQIALLRKTSGHS